MFACWGLLRCEDLFGSPLVQSLVFECLNGGSASVSERRKWNVCLTDVWLLRPPLRPSDRGWTSSFSHSERDKSSTIKQSSAATRSFGSPPRPLVFMSRRCQRPPLDGPSAAYHSRSSPDLLITLWATSGQKLASGLFLSPRSFGVNGKRNFSPPWSWTWSCSPLPAFHTTEPFLPSFILFFFRGLDPPAASPFLANADLGLIFTRHLSPGEISRPPPWALHLGDEQVKHGRSLSARH